MHLLLDKMSATVIVMTLFLMIFTVNARNGKTMAETTAFYDMTTQTEAFAKILRRDLQSIANIFTIDEDPQPDGSTEFRFESRIGLDTTLHAITYKKKFSQTRTFTRRFITGGVDSVYTIDFYTIERLVDGVVAGGSMDNLTDWEIRALNEDAGTITDPDDAAQIYVRFEAASPTFDMDVVQRILWESRFFPPLRN